ncbi:MAG: LysR family transcriptional regulator [Pseudomonadota bacterium]
MLPPLKALQSFEAVARTGSFTMAAEELGVTQSAVSHQVRHLEDFLGTKLLDRRGSGAVPNRAGGHLYQDLEQAMALIKKGVARVRNGEDAAPLGIWLRSHFASKWLAPRLSSFWQSHPGFDLRFHHSNAPADFSDPSIHVSIEWCHEAAKPAGSAALLNGNLTPACSPKLLKGESCPNDPALLTRHTLLHESDEGSWQDWLALTGASPLKPVRNEFYEDTNVRQQAAVEGAGFALICPELMGEEIQSGALVCPFPQHLTSYAYYLVIPREETATPRVAAFRQWILEQIDMNFPHDEMKK